MTPRENSPWSVSADAFGFATLHYNLPHLPSTGTDAMEPWETEIAEIKRIKEEAVHLSAKESEIGELLAAAIHHAHAAKAKLYAAVAAEIPPDTPEFMVGLWLDVQGTLAALYGVAAKSSYTTQKPVLNMQKLIDADTTRSGRSN